MATIKIHHRNIPSALIRDKGEEKLKFSLGRGLGAGAIPASGDLGHIPLGTLQLPLVKGYGPAQTVDGL